MEISALRYQNRTGFLKNTAMMQLTDRHIYKPHEQISGVIWRRLFKALFIFVLTGLSGCKDSNTENHAHSAETQYTCPMHPQVIKDAPGTCPICGMDLVKVTSSTASDNELMLSDSQMKLANITTKKVVKEPMGETVVISGTLSVNEEKSEVISSRAAGRIEKLFIRETGYRIKRGEPLYVLYSELLLTLQQEYLLAKEQYESLGTTEKRYASILKAAKGKLLLYGLTENQIAQLTSRENLQPRVTFLSPATGIVTAINASEGQYVNEGTRLYTIEDISSLWVEAELYPNETSLVKTGDKVTVRVAGFESIPVEAEVTFLSPEYRANTQITVMRAQMPNPDLQFTPGQHVQVIFTHSSREAIAVPLDAVIRDQKGSHVYIQSAENTFQPRMVKTGVEGFDRVEITEGITEGDTVAVTGAYLLYSEFVLKKGDDPMAGHNH